MATTIVAGLGSGTPIRMFGRFGGGVYGVRSFLRKVLVRGGFQIGRRGVCLVILGVAAGVSDRGPWFGRAVKGWMT